MQTPADGTRCRDVKIKSSLAGVWMKITIELESFAVKALLALSVAVWCAWDGQPEVAATVAALVASIRS
ncbi:hypothetical protein D3C71_1841610 [compost metagenome]|jgi:hypothetical protein